MSLVELSEMTGIYQNTNKADQRFADIKLHSWVRIKSGLYENDIGLVEGLPNDNKILLRVIPRIDMNPKKESDPKNRFASFKPPQKLFNTEEAIKIFGREKVMTR